MLQQERALVVVFLQPANRIPGRLFNDGIALLQPALAIGGVAIEERVEIAEIRCLARRLGVVIFFVSAVRRT
jgi:hypothetical protein